MAALSIETNRESISLQRGVGATVGFLGGLLLVGVMALLAGHTAMSADPGVVTLWVSALPLSVCLGIHRLSDAPPKHAILGSLKYTAVALCSFIFLHGVLGGVFASMLGVGAASVAGLFLVVAASIAGLAYAATDSEESAEGNVAGTTRDLVDWNARYEEATSRLAQTSVQLRRDREREERELAAFDRLIGDAVENEEEQQREEVVLSTNEVVVESH